MEKLRLQSQNLILRELLRRKLSRPSLLDEKFEKQNAFIRDSARLKAALCTRRAGKSYGAGLYLFEEALANPGVSCLYIALTRDSAKKIMVKDVLNPINKKYNIGAKLNKTELTYTLPNGSVIYLLGADADEQEKEKLLGQKYKLVVIDESASYSIDLRDLVYRILKPAMADLMGTIVMIGTPGNVTRGLYYDVTTGVEPGWSVHKWSALDNPHIKNLIRDEMNELIANNPAIVETPLWKQMYLGEWFVDTDKLVYKYLDTRNKIYELPQLKGRSTWNYVLGVDLGYEDATGFSVCAYNEYDSTLYIAHTAKKTKMDITDVADKIKELQKTYSFNKYIVDGANKQAVEEIKKRHGIPLEAAEKTGKVDFIEIMNSELIQSKIKVVKSGDEGGLIDEWLTLVWDEKSAKKQENPACPNHLSDATLYAWRWCYTYLAEIFKPKADPTSEEAVDEFWEKEAESLERNKALPFWSRDWGV
jgi:PBSX family phage terminase large subunit